jgi:hypothetical protein
MSKVNDYAKHLLSLPNSQRPKGRQFLPKRTGSVLAGKNQTDWEISVTKSTLTFHKNRWANLFSQPLNKWKKTL